MSYIDTLNAAYVEIAQAVREVGGTTSYAPNRVPVTFDTTRKISTLTFSVNFPQDKVSSLHMLDVEIAPVSEGSPLYRAEWKAWNKDHGETTVRDPAASAPLIVAAYEDAVGAYKARGRAFVGGPKTPAANLEPFSGYEARIQKVANDAARAFGLAANMPPESVPLVNDETLDRGVARLRAQAPAHFERRIDAFVGEAMRAYADAVIREAASDAHRISGLLRGNSPPDRKLDAAARAQDLSTLAFRTYARAAAYMRASSSPAFDTVQSAAKEARKYALSEYAKGAGASDEWNRLAEEGAVARAVLGTQTAARIRAALAEEDFTIPTFNGINRETAIILSSDRADAPFGPPILVGWTYPRVEKDRYGNPRAVARANVYAVLQDIDGGLLRDTGNPDDAFLAKIKAGAFSTENDSRARYGDLPLVILKTHLGGSYGYGGQTAVRVLVPLGNYAIRHVSRADVGEGRALEDYLDMLTRDAGYRYTYGAKKDSTGREIGRAKSGGAIKWISPDPFAPSPKR